MLYQSMVAPFIPSPGSSIFFKYIFPLIIFISLLALYTGRNNGVTHFQQAYRGENPSLGKGVRAVATIVFISAFFAWMIGNISVALLAYPTKYLAKDNSLFVGLVTHSYEHTFSFRGSNDIDLILLKRQQKAHFMWRSSKSKMIGIGACINITGKSWVFGTFVEDIALVQCPK